MKNENAELKRITEPLGWVNLPSLALAMCAGDVWVPERGYRFALLLLKLTDHQGEIRFSLDGFDMRGANGRRYLPLGICCSLTPDFRAAIGQPIPTLIATANAHIKQATICFGVAFAFANGEQNPVAFVMDGHPLVDVHDLEQPENAAPSSPVDTRISALSDVELKQFVPFGNLQGANCGFHEFVNATKPEGIVAIGHKELDVSEQASPLRGKTKRYSIAVVRAPQLAAVPVKEFNTDQISATLMDGTVLPCAGLVTRQQERNSQTMTTTLMSKAIISDESTILVKGGVAVYTRGLVCPMTGCSPMDRKVVAIFDERVGVETLAKIRIGSYEAVFESGTLVYAS